MHFYYTSPNKHAFQVCKFYLTNNPPSLCKGSLSVLVLKSLCNSAWVIVLCASPMHTTILWLADLIILALSSLIIFNVSSLVFFLFQAFFPTGFFFSVACCAPYIQ